MLAKNNNPTKKIVWSFICGWVGSPT